MSPQAAPPVRVAVLISGAGSNMAALIDAGQAAHSGYEVALVVSNIEGAGGLLVRLDTDGGTVLDLADTLRAQSVDVSFVVVAAPGLGTLNHCELTVGALRARRYEPAGLVIGAWPADPGLAERCNREDLPRVTGVPLLGVIPMGAGALLRAEFAQQAPGWLSA